MTSNTVNVALNSPDGAANGDQTMENQPGNSSKKGKHENPLTPQARRANLEQILAEIRRKKWTLGGFLKDLFELETSSRGGGGARDERRIQMHASFLKRGEGAAAADIAELMYTHHLAAPKGARSSINRRADEVEREDSPVMAHNCLREWAISKVEEIVDREAEDLSSTEGGLHLSNPEASWDFILNFSVSKAVTLIEDKGPTLLRLLIAAAYSKTERPQPVLHSVSTGMTDQEGGETVERPTYAVHVSKPLPSGSGQNSRDSFLIMTIAYLMLMNARNLRANLYQKIVAVWLFANNAAYELFTVLGRIGISVSYSTTLKLLRSISNAAKDKIRTKARLRAFLLIYDNINRMIRAWDPDLGQQDIIQNGTAATFVALEDCDVTKAFDPETLRTAQAEERRRGLNLEVLYNRVNWTELNAVMSVHCLSMLLDSVPCLHQHQDYVQEQLRGPLASHRMREHRVTEIHPLATSDFNEGNTGENARVLDDLLLRQLDLPKEEVEKLLVIVGGDQSTVEKLRALKKFLASCPHGYKRYGWVLPLIQLWHMGWADLERILSTHWGALQADDLSSLRSANVLLGRKVKDVKRPDYYPALHLVFDTLRADILDCWRTCLGESDLEKYFCENPATVEDLRAMAERIQSRYMTAEGVDRALGGGQFADHFFNIGEAWTDRSRPHTGGSSSDTLGGDQMLANTILRMRDSMLHYEFQYAIADGDIGRAMNVMAVWTFTFTGCGKNKYANELLELTCNFEFEYSSELKQAILNNWLCNLTGYPGCWFPMDLLQEKNIRQLKKMAQRGNIRFGGDFYKDIIALNIRGFLLSKESLRSMVRLNSRGGSHRRTAKEAAMRQLSSKMEEMGLHKFRAGRQRGHLAKDDFSAGYITFADTHRIKDFVERTLRDAGDIHAQGDDVDPEEPADMGDRAILPHMAVDGILTLGDESGLDLEEEGDVFGLDEREDVDFEEEVSVFNMEVD